MNDLAKQLAEQALAMAKMRAIKSETMKEVAKANALQPWPEIKRTVKPRGNHL
jgi:hypothetical protein